MRMNSSNIIFTFDCSPKEIQLTYKEFEELQKFFEPTTWQIYQNIPVGNSSIQKVYIPENSTSDENPVFIPPST
jgi:hypothetical protein